MHSNLTSNFGKLLLVALVTIMFGHLVTVDSKKLPHCDQNIMDNCTSRLVMLGDETFVFPINMNQMDKRCKEVKRLEKCAKDFAQKCLTSSTKQSISVLTYSIAKTNRGYCGSIKKKNAFISIGECANENKKALDKAINTMNRDFYAIKSYKNSKLRIPLVCCNYFKFKHAVIDILDKKCPQIIPEVENLVDGYAQDVLNLLCGDYNDESDKCGQIIGKTPKLTSPVQSKVFINPLVDILNSV